MVTVAPPEDSLHSALMPFVVVNIVGVVQSVGFRPHVARCAKDSGVSGRVRNDSNGVKIHAQGSDKQVDDFLAALKSRAPRASRIDLFKIAKRSYQRRKYYDFKIAETNPGKTGASEVVLCPDIAICDDCTREIDDEADRRSSHALNTCTNCGPRYSIFNDIPYDRETTTMRAFPVCDECRAEYLDVSNRRFHAQTVSCVDCGPQLRLSSIDGVDLPGAPVIEARRLLASGQILAVKGLAGYHLMVDPRNEAAIARLRKTKVRPRKPLALVARDILEAKKWVAIGDEDATLLQSPGRPIVILPRAPECDAASGVAPGICDLGIMLPSTGTQHLLLEHPVGCLVATSANVAGAPIITDDQDAFASLLGIADYVLWHDRPIASGVDDSVVRAPIGHELTSATIVRRGRGMAPLPIASATPLSAILALGSDLKNTVAVSRGSHVFVSEHIGDVAEQQTYRRMDHVVQRLLRLTRVKPSAIVHDLHPNFRGRQYAENFTECVVYPVQHHHAHVASCLFENQWDGPAIGIAFDGAGYGEDGTIWGGEFFHVQNMQFKRVAHIKTFNLLGNDRAAWEPYRPLAAALLDALGHQALELPLAAFGHLDEAQKRALAVMNDRGIQSTRSSSMGRIFDACAAVLNLVQVITYEGEAASVLEGLLGNDLAMGNPYPFEVRKAGQMFELDLAPALIAICGDVVQKKVAPEAVSRRFHSTVVVASAMVASELCRQYGCDRVALSGGVFANRFISKNLPDELRRCGQIPLSHLQVPPGDGGISLGQIAIANRLHMEKQA